SLDIQLSPARSHFVCSHFCNLARIWMGWLLEKPPIRHLDFAAGLAVDSPARPVIMRSTSFGALIDVAEYAEMKVGILVKNCAFRIHVRAEVPGNEVPISARLLGKLANVFATGPAGILEQRGPAIGGKLIKRVGHDHSSSYFAEFRALTPTKRVPFRNLLPICWNEQMPATASEERKVGDARGAGNRLTRKQDFAGAP